MPGFIDNLLAASWAIKAANGGYLGFDPSQVDPTGAPYAITVPSRANAVFFTFSQVQQVSPGNYLVTLHANGANRYLGVNASGALVFGPVGGAAVNFNAVSVRSTQLLLGQNLTASGGSFANLDSVANRFSMVAGGSGPQARLGLAPPLPQGALLWSSGDPHPVIGTPYIYGGGVFATDGGKLLSCLDQLSGAILWETGEGTAGTCPVEINYANRNAYVGDGTGLLHAVSIDTGAQVWTFQASAPVYARPGAYVDRLYVPSSDGVLYALSSATGAQLWRYPATGNLTGLFSTPATAGQAVFVGGWDQQMHAVDATTGQALWTYQAGDKVNGGIETDAANLYFGVDSNQLVALRQSDGGELWLYPTNGIVSGAPLSVAGNLFFGSIAGDVACVTAATGVKVWQVNVGAPIASAAQYADGLVYFNTTTGKLYALDAATGTVAASYQAPAPTGGSAVVLSGVAYLAAGGQIQCLTASMVQDFVPMDLMALLMLSSWTNAPNGQAPVFGGLPAGWTNLGAFASSQALTFATAGVTTLTLPGTDQAVTAVTFGVDPNDFLIHIDTSAAGLVALPASIGGSAAPAGLQVNAAILASYLAVRTQVLAAVTQGARSSVRVAGLGGGGALAALAALDLSITAGKPGMPQVSVVQLVTFGAPALGNAPLANFLSYSLSSILQIVSVTDTTPDLLPAASGYAPTGHRRTIGAVGVTTSPSVDPASFKAYRTSLVGR